LFAQCWRASPLLRFRQLTAALLAACAAVAGAAASTFTTVLALRALHSFPTRRSSDLIAATARADVLGLALRLRGVGVVAGLRLRFGVGVLVVIARAAADVAAGDRDGGVRVDGVLLADADRERSLLGVRGLETELRCPG